MLNINSNIKFLYSTNSISCSALVAPIAEKGADTNDVGTVSEPLGFRCGTDRFYLDPYNFFTELE